MGCGFQDACEHIVLMGSLGTCSCSLIYLLMPLMMCWTNGESHAEKDRPASMWADHRCVTYDLIVLGWSLLAPPSQVTHLSSMV